MTHRFFYTGFMGMYSVPRAQYSVVGGKKMADLIKTYSVRDVCRMTGVTRKTLFYYDRVHLLSPYSRSGVQGHKVYDDAGITRLKRILRLRNAALTIKEIAQILDDPACDIPGILQGAIVRAQTEQADTEEQIRLLRELIREYREPCTEKTIKEE